MAEQSRCGVGIWDNSTMDSGLLSVPACPAALSEEEQAAWNTDGYFIRRGFVGESVTGAMIRRVEEIARSVAAGEPRTDLIVNEETALAQNGDAGARLSKIFRVMRCEDVFRSFATDPRLLAIVGKLLGGEVDCFLSQFIFKHPGALGQPWHQDNFYFRLEPSPQVGVWLACTEATPENGPLWVVPGSHREHIHAVVPDRREHAGAWYVEIVDADVEAAEVVLMSPGDLLVFHSHLRHMSTDNRSQSSRAAMVYHYAAADSTGDRASNQDWVGVIRGGVPVSVSAEPVPVAR